MELKQQILESIQNGKKAIDLYLDINHDSFNEADITKDKIDAAIEELIHAGEIIELEYTVPNMDYRIKSIYFPKGTSINIRKF